MPTVGEVCIFSKILDGGYFVRCAGCEHPARITPNLETGRVAQSCVVCGRSLDGAPPCTEDVYRASRHDDAPVPFTGDAPPPSTKP